MDENILSSIEEEINEEYNKLIEYRSNEMKKYEKKKAANRRYANKSRLKKIIKYKKIENDNIYLNKDNISLKSELEKLKKKIERKDRQIILLKKKNKKKSYLYT